MSHELRYLQDQRHEVFTNILIAGGVGALVMVLLVMYLRWKHPKVPMEPVSKNATPRARRKRRRKH